MEILCNECFQPLIVHEYDIGIYVDTCDCQKEKYEILDEELSNEIENLLSIYDILHK